MIPIFNPCVLPLNGPTIQSLDWRLHASSELLLCEAQILLFFVVIVISIIIVIVHVIILIVIDTLVVVGHGTVLTTEVVRIKYENEDASAPPLPAFLAETRIPLDMLG